MASSLKFLIACAVTPKALATLSSVSSTEGYQVNQIEDLQADIDQYHPLG
jgi:hypothetical protein